MADPEQFPSQDPEALDPDKTDDYTPLPPEKEPDDSSEAFKQGREDMKNSSYIQDLKGYKKSLEQRKRNFSEQDHIDEEIRKVDEKIQAWEDEVKKKAIEVSKKNKEKDGK